MKKNQRANNIECTICGKNTDKIYRVDIEGSILEVCEDCVKFGENLGEVKSTHKKVVTIKKIAKPIEDETFLVENYGKLIIETRKKMNLTREEFAKKINEKESLIRRIEKMEMRPNDKLIDKIERFLEIKLRIQYETKKFKSNPSRGKLTIGDVIEVE